MAVFEFFDGLNAGRRQFSQRLLGLWSAVSWGEGAPCDAEPLQALRTRAELQQRRHVGAREPVATQLESAQPRSAWLGLGLGLGFGLGFGLGRLG